MSDTQHHDFTTPYAVDLAVEIGKGAVRIRCADVAESSVDVNGQHAADVVVEQDGDRIRVVEPRRTGGFFRDTALRVDIVVPTHSELTVRLGSATLEVLGAAADTHLRSGSGDMSAEVVAGRLQVETGSGDLSIREAHGPARLKSGSGDVRVGLNTAELSVFTGSGDVEVDRVEGPVTMKTGSGDMRARESRADVSGASGSGDLVVDRAHRGRVTAKGASTDVRVGVPAGVPVWTDLSTVTGAIRSQIQGVGQPAEGQDHVELRVTTVSGDITLAHA